MKETFTCAICGEEHEYSDLWIAYNSEGHQVYVCDDCLDSTFVCGGCGSRYLLECKNEEQIDGEDWCNDCVRTKTGTCDYCGRLVSSRSLYELHNGDHYCEDCRDDHTVMCEDCGELFDEDDPHVSRYEDICGYLCDDCRSEDYEVCECCGTLMRREYLTYHDEAYYCECCGVPSRRRDYHDAPSTRYFYPDKSLFEYQLYEPFKGLGVELEIDYGDAYSVDDIIEDLEKLHEEDEIYYCRDGSLSDDGIEIITMPHTPEAFWNIRWEEIMQTCLDYDYTSHDNGNCGLHIHFSREWFGEDESEQDERIQNIIRLYEWRYNDFLKASRRGASSQWARRYLSDEASGTCPSKEKCADVYKSNNKSWHSNRYRTVNLINSETIEFRLGRGTLNYKTFRAWIDLHIAIVRNCCDITDDNIQNLSAWFKGIEPETVGYLHRREAFMDYSTAKEEN